MLPEPDSNILAGFEKHMLREVSDVVRLNEALGTPSSFMDAELKRSGRAYGKFILACRKAGLVEFSLVAYSVQGVFFVKTQNGKQRSILDYRRANRFFVKKAPGTKLITGEGFGVLAAWELFWGRPILILAAGEYLRVFLL